MELTAAVISVQVLRYMGVQSTAWVRVAPQQQSCPSNSHGLWNCLQPPLPASLPRGPAAPQCSPGPLEDPTGGHGSGVGSGQSPSTPLCSPPCRTPVTIDPVTLLPHHSRRPHHTPVTHGFVNEQVALAARKSNL